MSIWREYRLLRGGVGMPRPVLGPDVLLEPSGLAVLFEGWY